LTRCCLTCSRSEEARRIPKEIYEILRQNYLFVRRKAVVDLALSYCLLRKLIVDRHLFLMILEVLATFAVVMLCLKRFDLGMTPRAVLDVTPASTPPPPNHTPHSGPEICD
jgi:hypothetical protein